MCGCVCIRSSFPAPPWRVGFRGHLTQFRNSLPALEVSEEDQPSVTTNTRQLATPLIRSASPPHPADHGGCAHSGVRTGFTAIVGTQHIVQANPGVLSFSSLRKMMSKQGREAAHIYSTWSPLPAAGGSPSNRLSHWLALQTGHSLEDGAACICAVAEMGRLTSRPCSHTCNVEASPCVPLSGSSAFTSKVRARLPHSALKRESLHRVSQGPVTLERSEDLRNIAGEGETPPEGGVPTAEGCLFSLTRRLIGLHIPYRQRQRAGAAPAPACAACVTVERPSSLSRSTSVTTVAPAHLLGPGVPRDSAS